MLIIQQLKRTEAWIAACILLFCASVRAQELDTVGWTLLQSLTTNVNGAGIRVGQPEASTDTNGVYWEVNPGSVHDPQALFTWYSNALSNTSFPNPLGGESGHADSVADIFYGPSGVAPNVAHADNFQADAYINYNIANDKGFSTTATDAVVNQSYTAGAVDATTQKAFDSDFDDFSVTYNTLFVSAANNSGNSARVCPPGTSYNCICVGADEGYSSVGPTIDNGRCKPDIVAPGQETSFTTPYVAGAAALLMQAGRRGDGGADTNSAWDMRTIKALLLNGAVKQANWTNIAPSPLDYANGAGMLNVFNSYEQLAAGKHPWNFSTNVPQGTAHPPVVTTASVPVLNGWDFNTNDSTSTKDGVNHYFFNATNASKAGFTFTATLVWNRHESQSAINNLALYLYNAANSNLVAASTSVVDNVQHVFIHQLPQGRYDLQVWKAGGSGIVSTNESYALAWEIVSELLKVKEAGTNMVLSWPVYPAGYTVAAAPALTSPFAWSTNGIPSPVVTNNQNVVTIPQNNNDQFFRLQTPNF